MLRSPKRGDAILNGCGRIILRRVELLSRLNGASDVEESSIRHSKKCRFSS